MLKKREESRIVILRENMVVKLTAGIYFQALKLNFQVILS